MLQMLWQFLSSFLPGAGCQGSREGSDQQAPGTPPPPPPPARGDAGPSFLGKQDGRAEAAEKRPTILLVVGPAEQFPKVKQPPEPPTPTQWRGLAPILFLERPGLWGGREDITPVGEQGLHYKSRKVEGSSGLRICLTVQGECTLWDSEPAIQAGGRTLGVEAHGRDPGCLPAVGRS